MGWGKVVGCLAAVAVAAGGGVAIGVATRSSAADTATKLGVAAQHPPSSTTLAASPSTIAAPTTTTPASTTTSPPSTAMAPPATAPITATTVAQPGGAVAGAVAAAPGAPASLSPLAFTPADPTDPNVAALASRLAPVVSADPGCLIVTQGTQTLFASNPTTLVAPGSSQKLLVAAAALDVLGPNYTFTTQVVAPAAPVNGVVSDLWLVGGGDPVLETPAFNAWWTAQPRYSGDPFTDITQLASAVRAAGVTTVTGGVHGDDARYDDVRSNPTWPADDLTEGDINPVSALTLDMGYQSWTTDPAVVPPDPPSFAASTFDQLLTAAGVNAPDNPPGADGTPPVGSVVVASIQSPPLSQIIGAMLRPSDNQIAELLTKELGYHATGLGTTAAGLAVVQQVDTRLGMPWNGTIMVDGSGLSHTDRTTCQTLMAAQYLGDQPNFASIPQGMSVAGENGTLADRFTTAPIQGHLHAKTGSIDGAAAMVGELDLGAPVRFAMVFNQEVSDSQLIDDEDAAVAAIAPYP